MEFVVKPVGYVKSTLQRLEDAPMQGYEGAPDAWIMVEAEVEAALKGLAVGDEVFVLTWFHLAGREVLQVHPRDDESQPLTGVFATRSSDRPNPIGLHRVKVLEMGGNAVKVGPLEAIDGTPVVDMKPVLGRGEGY